MKKCKICGAKTETIFNINLEAVPICEDCAKSIFIQQAVWYNKQKSTSIDKSIFPTAEEIEKYALGAFGYEPGDADKENAFISGAEWYRDEINRKLNQ